MMSPLWGGDWLWRRCNSSSVAVLHKGLPFQCFTIRPYYTNFPAKPLQALTQGFQLYSFVGQLCIKYANHTTPSPNSGSMCTPAERSLPNGSSGQLN